jgi:hypothetical protein
MGSHRRWKNIRGGGAHEYDQSQQRIQQRTHTRTRMAQRTTRTLYAQ